MVIVITVAYQRRTAFYMERRNCLMILLIMVVGASVLILGA